MRSETEFASTENLTVFASESTHWSTKNFGSSFSMTVGSIRGWMTSTDGNGSPELAVIANATAVNQGADEVRTEIDRREWVQQPFPYQAKCLHWIRQEYARLDGQDRVFVDEVLTCTGCEQLLAKPKN